MFVLPKNDSHLKRVASWRFALSGLLLLALGACWRCDPPAVIDLGNIPDSVMQLNPYEDGKTYRFRHSGGLVIEYRASRQSHEEWIRCERCCTYEYKYEVNSTILTPDYPVSGFRIELTNPDSTLCTMGASTGYYYFNLPTNDYQHQYVERVDSVMVDGKMYWGVFKVKSDYGYWYDREILYADSLYYSYTDGIIRLIMSNGETFTRDE